VSKPDLEDGHLGQCSGMTPERDLIHPAQVTENASDVEHGVGAALHWRACRARFPGDSSDAYPLAKERPLDGSDRVVLAFGFVVLTYYRSSHSYAGSQGDSDGEMFLGRWWEPAFTVFLALIGYVLWLVGVGAGIATAAGVSVVRTRRKASPAN
jgi:hypothetical protein